MFNIFSFIILNFILFYIFSIFAKKINLIDIPDFRKIHTGNIPLIGGLCIYLSIFLFSFFIDFNYFINLIIYSSAIILFVGLIDDSKQIGVTIRIISQIITCLIVIGGGLSIINLGEYYTYNTLNLGILGILLTCLSVLALTNAINFIDGIDGLASGIIVISLASIYAFSFFQGSLINTEIIVFLIVSILIFFIFNLKFFNFFNKVFLGDSGSTTLGFILGFLLIFFTHPDHRNFHPVLAAWCVSLPIYDLLAVLIRRICRGINPFRPDRRHIHHLLLDKKIKPKNVLIIILSSSVILNVIGGFIYFNLGALSSLISFVLFLMMYLALSFNFIRKI